MFGSGNLSFGNRHPVLNTPRSPPDTTTLWPNTYPPSLNERRNNGPLSMNRTAPSPNACGESLNGCPRPRNGRPAFG